MTKCSKCGGDNILVGAFALSCSDCGWHYLNKHPCSTCGAPATSCMGTRDFAIYGCKSHPITQSDIDRAIRLVGTVLHCPKL